jgi:hypothetical protein
MKFKTIQDILNDYRVKTYKETSEGLLAIHKWKRWIYFRWYDETQEYKVTGSTEKFSR